MEKSYSRVIIIPLIIMGKSSTRKASMAKNKSSARDKKEKINKKSVPEKQNTDHRQDFDTLLDDAIFGVRKKPRR